MNEPYQSPPDFHRHQCLDCGCIWEHRNWSSPNKDRCTGPAAEHSCPACGIGYETARYDGDSAPEKTTRV